MAALTIIFNSIGYNKYPAGTVGIAESGHEQEESYENSPSPISASGRCRRSSDGFRHRKAQAYPRRPVRLTSVWR
jgi:hypothetical protein